MSCLCLFEGVENAVGRGELTKLRFRSETESQHRMLAVKVTTLLKRSAHHISRSSGDPATTGYPKP